jgi:hypothetical protein
MSFEQQAFLFMASAWLIQDVQLVSRALCLTLTLLLLLVWLSQGGPSPQTSPRGSNSGPAARPAAGRSTAVHSSAAGKPPAGAGRASKPAAAASAGGGGSATAAGDDGAVDESALSGGLLNAHEAKSRLSELLGEEMVTALGDAQWKVSLRYAK